MRRELVNLGWFIAAATFGLMLGVGAWLMLWMIGELT